jgi:preprotein translocase subunit SecF
MKRGILPIVRLRKVWYVFSALLIAGALVLVGMGGLKLGIDFSGGTLHEITFTTERPANDKIEETLGDIVGEPRIQPSGDKNVILRYGTVDNETRQKVIDALTARHGAIEEVRFDSIGPTIGNELKRNAIWSIILVMAAIIIYLTYAFRKVSEPVRSWKYGVLAIVTLLHDVLMVIGAFAFLGLTRGAEADSLFLIALLTTLGYSVHDTIVVFDRTRTNLIELGSDQFEKAVELATNQTLVRSLNTALTTTISLVALLLFGGDTLFNFVLALLVGVVAGTYSSIFVSSPLLVTWHRFSEKRRLAKAAKSQ